MEATNRVQLEEEISGLVLTYRINDTLLCVPVEDVESIIEPPAITELPNAPDYVLGAFMHRGQTALALSLHKLLGLPVPTAAQRKESLLVIWMGNQPVGYWVDEVKGMTDSNRGHWSAVPALIRDQGITKALICDGQVYFPIDLTHSKQFNEILRALKAYEQSKLQGVWDETDVKAEQADQPQLDTAEESLLIEPDAERLEEQTVTEDELAPTEDSASEGAELVSLEGQAEISEELPSVEQDLPPQPEPTVEGIDNDVNVVDYQVDDLLAADNDEQNEASFLAEQGIDTAALAKAMYAVMSGNAEVIPLPQAAELEFDANGQADAFHDLIAEAEERFGPVALVEDSHDETAALHGDITETQVDAFDGAYQALLAQDLLGADTQELDASEQEYITARESLDDFAEVDEPDLIEEPTSFLPSTLPEDTEQALPDEDITGDDVATDVVDSAQQAELRQSEIESAFIDDAGITDELLEDETVSDELNLTEEPYSFLPTSLPEEDDVDEQALLDETNDDDDDVATDNMDSAQQAELRQSEIESAFIDDAGIADELLEDETASDEINLTEEPYSFLPTSLPDDDEPALLDENIDEAVIGDVVDDLDGEETISAEPGLSEQPESLLPATLPEDAEPDDAAIDTQASSVQKIQPVMLLPHLSDGVEDSVRTDNLSTPPDRNLSERPVIALPHETDKTASLPEFAGVVSKADFYTDKMVTLLKDAGVEFKPADTAYEKVEIKNKSQAFDEPQAEQPSAELYELKIPPITPDDEPPEPAPSLGEKYIAPQLEQGAVILRPDGQINKNFGLVKLFTIILATSAAGSWWYRDELFYREQLRKEIPSILRNEIAFLYSDRVTIVSPEKGTERMIVDTPEQEIKVIRRRHVSSALLRESRKKEVTIHRVRKGDTLWAIASLYLDDPYRYPELAENNRIHNSDLIRPGDVVKITTKKPDTDE